MTPLSRIIDAHVHFWDPSALHYPWLSDVPGLQRSFLAEDLSSLAEGLLDGVVFVEANCRPSQSLDELDFIDAQAERGAPILGSVAFVDLLDAERRTAALKQLAQRKHVVGVRHNIQRQPAGFALQPDFVRGVQEVGGMGLTFDICITAGQLAEATDLVGQCPGTMFVLDHCGKPDIAAGDYEPWAAGLRHLADYHNVACKLSGLLSEARPEQRSADGLGRFVRHAMDCFGTDRLLYGSDWPVVTTAGGEPLWRALVHELTSDWSGAARQAFFSGNAERTYGLPRNART